MTNIEPQSDAEDISIFGLGALFLRNRGRILGWALAGAVVALAVVWTRPITFRASASFIPQGADPARSGLASLAGQFGVAVSPTSSPSLTPDFYLRLITSREVLAKVAHDTVTVPELGGKRDTVEDLLDIGSGSPKVREEAAVGELGHRISADASKTTGIVEFTVATKWPSVSLAIANGLLAGINEFNERTRRDQAAAERKFIEGRLAVAGAELRASEDRLQQFLQSNRQFRSPELQFTQDRMQRDVTLRQQVVGSLTQSYEEVRMREVRDIPVITMVDDPSVPAKPEARGRGVRTLLGFLIGAGIGAFLVFVGDQLKRRRAKGDPDADAFVRALTDIKRRLFRRPQRAAGNSV